MDKYFYFRTQADQDNDDGIDDSLCLPVRMIRSMNPSSDTAITITFDSVYNTSTDGDNDFWKLDTIHTKLRKAAWLWADQTENNQTVVFEWQPNDVTSNIWRYPDPNLWSDAVKPSGWTDGFNWFSYGNNDNRRFDRSDWHSGWIGYHAKWVEGEGEFGENCMKFIDQNSQFNAPNHNDYQGLHRTAFNTDENENK